jgi:hypothetical protein
MLLPIRCGHDCRNRCACGHPEHRNNSAVFRRGRGADLDEAGADLARDAALRIFRAVERVVAFGLDLGFVTGFSEVYAAPSAAPRQPRLGKSPGRARPRSQLSRSKSTQQCSDQARKPVNSEPDNCSSLGLLGRRQAARTVDPDSTIRRFESSHPSQRFLWSPRKCLNDSEMVLIGVEGAYKLR